MIKGLAAATLLGLGALALGIAGVAFVVPVLVYRRWRRRMYAVPE